MPNGEQVEQALGRMRMPAVARIDHVDVHAVDRGQVLRNEMGSAARAVANDEHVRIHRN